MGQLRRVKKMLAGNKMNRGILRDHTLGELKIETIVMPKKKKQID